MELSVNLTVVLISSTYYRM